MPANPANVARNLPLSGAPPARAAGPPSRGLPARSSGQATTRPRNKAASTFKTGKKVKPLDKRDVMMVVTQLSIMTRSGVDVADAIRSIAERAAKPDVRDALRKLHSAVEEGNRLSQAFAAQSERFGGILVATVAAGEASGTLPEVLARLRILMRDELRTRAAIRSVVSYPLVLTVVTMGVLGAMIFFVLPQFGKIYASSRAPTPAITQMLLSFAGAVREYWWVVALAVGGAVLGAWRLTRSPWGRTRVDRLAYRLPLVRDVNRSLGIGRVFRLQGVLLESGIPLLEVLQLTKSVVRNSLMKALNERMQHQVLIGQTMSSALVHAECVPDGALEMVATAEANGDLADVLQTVGEFFESEGEQKLKDVVKIAEPAIIVGLGLVVGAIVLAVMLPMLDLSAVGGR